MKSSKKTSYEIDQGEEYELWMLISQVRKELLLVSDRELKKRFGISTAVERSLGKVQERDSSILVGMPKETFSFLLV